MVLKDVDTEPIALFAELKPVEVEELNEATALFMPLAATLKADEVEVLNELKARLTALNDVDVDELIEPIALFTVLKAVDVEVLRMTTPPSYKTHRPKLVLDCLITFRPSSAEVEVSSQSYCRPKT